MVVDNDFVAQPPCMIGVRVKTKPQKQEEQDTSSSNEERKEVEHYDDEIVEQKKRRPKKLRFRTPISAKGKVRSPIKFGEKKQDQDSNKRMTRSATKAAKAERSTNVPTRLDFGADNH